MFYYYILYFYLLVLAYSSLWFVFCNKLVFENSVSGNVLQNVWLPVSDCSRGVNVWVCVILISFNGSLIFLDTCDHIVELPMSGILKCDKKLTTWVRYKL